MKKRNIIIFSVTVLLLSVLSYFGYYSFFLKDEYSIYMQEYPSIAENIAGERISLEAEIFNWDEEKCKIKYCILNSCNNENALPCNLMKINEYETQGFYTVILYFNKYKNFPFSKTYLKEWEILKSDVSKSNMLEEDYLQGVIEVIKKYPIREGYRCLITRETHSVDKWVCNKEEDLNSEYFKALYMTYELGIKLKNDILLSTVEKEIEYLNNNILTILEKDISSPEAYILKLIEIGLDKGYKKIIEEFVIPEYKEHVIEDHDLMPLISLDSDIYSNYYQEIVRDADYYRIFTEYGEEDLAHYYKNELISRYNESEYVLYGLCTLGNSISSTEIFEYISRKLEQSITNGGDFLILKSLPELIMCKRFSESMGTDIKDLESLIIDTAKKSSLEIGGQAYIVNAKRVCQGEEAICNHMLLDYHLVDNLMYLLYE